MTTQSTLRDLKREYDDPAYLPSKFGPLLFAELCDVAKYVVRKPQFDRHWQTYNSGIKWEEGEIDGLASETATEFLIKQRQLAYVMQVEKKSVLRFRLEQQVERCLFARRPKDVFDNLLRRVGEFDYWEFSTTNYLTDAEIDEIANSLRDIRPNYEAERRIERKNESPIFTKAQLDDLLKRLLENTELILKADKAGISDKSGLISKPDLRKIFEKLLTDWGNKALERNEDQLRIDEGEGKSSKVGSYSDPTVTSALQKEIKAEMEVVIQNLDNYEVRLLKRVLLDGANYSQVAAEVGKTRQTVASNVQVISQRLKEMINNQGDEDEKDQRARLFARELESRYEIIQGEIDGV